MMEVDTGATARVDSPPVVVAREASLPRPSSPHTSEEKTMVDTGDVQSYNHDEGPDSHTKLFTHDDNHESYDLWVHSNLPDRAVVVASIEGNGGRVVGTIEEAFFAIIHSDMSPNDYPELCNDEEGTVGISLDWVLDSVRTRCLKSPEDYIVWRPEEDDDEDEDASSGAEDDNNFEIEMIEPDLLLSLPSCPPISDLPPSPATRSLDEEFFIWLVPRFFGPRPAAPWINIYRWLGAKIQHRPEKYWTALNNKGTEVRRKSNAILKQIFSKFSKPTRPTVIRHHRKKLNSRPGDEILSARRDKYSAREYEAMIKHIASHPELKGEPLWIAFHAKHPNRAVKAYTEHHRKHRAYFDAAVQKFLLGDNHSLHSSGSSAPTDTRDETSSEPSSGVKAQRTDMTGSSRVSFGYHRPKYTREEHQAMKEFYAKHKHEYPKEIDLWGAFAELHPGRTASAMQSYFVRHPDIRAGTHSTPRRIESTSQVTQSSSPGLASQSLNSSGLERKGGPRRFTPEEDQVLIRFARRRGYPMSIPTIEWEELSRKNPSRSYWGWKTRYTNHIYLNRHKIDQDYVLSNGSASRSNGSAAVPSRTLKRSPSNEGLNLPPSKRIEVEAAPASHVSAHAASPAAIAPPAQSNTVTSTTNIQGSLASKFTREDLAAAINWVTMRTRPKSMFQNLASWEQFAEQHPSHDSEEWVQYYYSKRELFQLIEQQLETP